MRHNKSEHLLPKTKKGGYVMRKRLFSLLLALCLCPIFSGCGNKNVQADVFYYTFSDTYISSVRTALRTQLRERGFDTKEYDAAGSQTTQTEQVRTALTGGARVLLVNLVNTGSDDAASEIVALAREAGVPLIFFNREVSDEVVNSYPHCAFVGTRAEEAGILQGEMIGEYLVQNFEAVDRNGDGEISYIMFKGEEGNNEAIYRTKYSVEKANELLAAAGKKPLRFYDAANTNRYLVDKNGQWSAAAANDYMTTVLTSYNTANNNMVELVICNNDGMAEGAISALAAAGFNAGGDSPAIPVFGVDATDAAVALIRDGKMTGTVKQDADGMAQALARLTANALDENKGLMDDTGDLQLDKTVRKVRIPYAKYLGA